MDVAALLERIQSRRDYAGQLEHIETLPARPGKFAEPEGPLPPELTALLATCGVDQLYSHQVAALEAARAGQDWVTVTGTASGKTLCFNLPVLESMLASAESRALYLYPTKALAQDQLKGLLELVGEDERLSSVVRPGVYDGDTPTAQRRRIRNEANLVLSNPDMLHAAILPYHPKWSQFFSELRYIVIDEVHSYRGILGANVAAVLRRLLRVCKHYGSRPAFLSTSATIANPGELVGRLIGREVEVIDDDGSPRGRKHFALWNPTPLGVDSLARRSANDDAVMLMQEAVEADGQVLAFTRTRQAAELIHRYVRQSLAEERSPHADKVRAYRGGYLPNERRQIEQDLFSGNLRAVSTTNALELGIDVGSLDVALLVNYPGTIASCWQQAGRSGRRTDESLAVLIASNDPVDQYLLRHPDYFFAQTPEHAVVDPDNPYVTVKHLKSAAFELPLTQDDLAGFGSMAASLVDVLCQEEQLVKVKDEYYHPGGQNPSVGVSLRHASDNTFSIVLVNDRDRGAPVDEPRPHGQPSEADHTVIANVDSVSAPELVYPEAVYLHNGLTYLVRKLDLDGKVAYVERRETDYYTQAISESNVRVTEEREQSDAVRRATLGYGDVDVSWQTVAFKKIKFATRENVGLGPVDIPAQQLQTTAFWLAPDGEVRAAIKSAGLRPNEGLVGLRNLAVVALPFVSMCDSRDLSGVVSSQHLGRSAVIVYDRYPGGLGYSERGFRNIEQLLNICREIVADCPCEAGCPSCIGLPNPRPTIHSDPDLTRGHPMPNKQATIQLLNLLTNPSVVVSQQMAVGV